MLPYLRRQNILNCQPCRVGNVNDPPGAMATFPRQMVGTVLTTEWNALLNQPVDRMATIFNNEAGGGNIIEKGTSGQRVLDMCFNRILNVEDSRDSALRPTGSTVLKTAFADQTNLAMFCEPKGCGLPRQTAPNHQNVDVDCHDNCPDI